MGRPRPQVLPVDPGQATQALGEVPWLDFRTRHCDWDEVHRAPAPGRDEQDAPEQRHVAEEGRLYGDEAPPPTCRHPVASSSHSWRARGDPQGSFLYNTRSATVVKTESRPRRIRVGNIPEA
jgi:hypothetical protein